MKQGFKPKFMLGKRYHGGFKSDFYDRVFVCEVTGLKDQIEELTEQLDEELKSEIKKLQSTINEKALEHTQTVTDLNNLTQKNLQLKITVDSNASKLQKLEVLSSQLKASQNVVTVSSIIQ